MLPYSLLNFSFVVVNPMKVLKGIYVLFSLQSPWNNFANSIQSVVLDFFFFLNFPWDRPPWSYFLTIQLSFDSSLLTFPHLSLAAWLVRQERH